MLDMVVKFAKEMQRKLKLVISNHAQLIANGTIGMSGNNVVSLVEEDSLQGQEM